MIMKPIRANSSSRSPVTMAAVHASFERTPFENLYEFLDGMTCGPTSFKGPIGKAINEDLRLLPIANFQPLNGCVNKVPEIIISKLSTDQSFLHHICKTVQYGREYLLYHNVTKNSPGVLNQAR